MKICVATVLSIALLLGNSVNLRASITGRDPWDDGPDDGPVLSQAGQTCCQETAAIVGILQGSKGDAGEPGPFGPPGVRGALGVKGQTGLKGPIGPQGDSGPKGLVGLTGQTGVKGQKDGPGETPDNSNQQVAFTVVRTRHSDTSTSNDYRLPFQETQTLLPGTNFDLEINTFTCSMPGTYVFMFSVNKIDGSRLHVFLCKNGEAVVAGVSADSSNQEQVSGSAVVVLQRGDMVNLTIHGRAGSGPYHATSFSGFLHYPQ